MGKPDNQKSGEKDKAASVPRVTLNLVGDFPSPWRTDAETLEHVNANKWHPTTTDFQAIYRGTTPIVVTDLSNFLGAIRRAKPGSIERVNLWTHANRGLIGLSGTIDRETGAVTFSGRARHIDRSLSETDPIMKNGGTIEQESMGAIARQLRDRFAPGAKMYIYACNSGIDFEVLDALANAFGIEVGGLPSEVFTFVNPKPGGKLERGLTSMMKAPGTEKPGFRHLEGSFVFRKPRAEPKR